jgi:Flp pilus assembly protein TadD
MGKLEERGGDLRCAFGNFNRAIELDESHVGARVRRGQIYLLGGEAEAAERDRVAAPAPDDPDALMLRAGVRLRSGNPGGAEEDARTALELRPGHAAASVLLAENLIQRGDLPGAIALLERAIETNPDTPELRLILGGPLDSAGDVEGALEAALERAMGPHGGMH